MTSPDRIEAGHVPTRTAALLGRITRHRALAPALLAGLILLFFNRMAFTNLILARGDTFLYFYPYWEAAAGALRDGRIPLWNPDIFMGAPFLANSQVGFFYPLNWPVWLLLPTPYAVNASILIHLAIAGGGAYLAGKRTLGLGRTAALFAAILFALGGYLTAQVEHINQLQGLAWLPWFFAALAPLVAPGDTARTWHDTTWHDTTWHDTTRHGVLPIALTVGVLFALQLLAGHTQTVFISGVAVSLWLAIHVLEDLTGRWIGVRRPVRSGVKSAALRGILVVLPAAVVLAALLAAVQLLPTFELTGQSSRQGGLPLNEVLSFSWNPLHLTRALLPGYGPSLFTEYVAFLPLTALALAVVGAWAWRRNQAVRPWLVLVLIALILALGRFTAVYYLLGRWPGFDLFRAPARWLAVAALGIALLAGYGWQRLRVFTETEWPPGGDRERARRELIRPLAAAAAGLALLILWGYMAGWVARFVPAGAEAPFERPTPIALLGWLIEFALAALLLWVILTGPAERARGATVELLILAVAALWLGSRGLPYNQLTTPEAYFDLRPPQARLMALGACSIPDRPCAVPPDRFLSLSDIFFDPGDTAEIESIYADQLSREAIYDYIVAVKNKEVLSPNLSMITQSPAIDGFDGGILPLRTYSELMGLILPEGDVTTDGRLREYLTAAPDARWLSLFNGRYLITDKTGDVWREGVFFDRQHPARIDDRPVGVADIPAFEATELWLIAEGTPPPIEVTATGGDVWQLVPELLAAPDLYRASFPRPAAAEDIVLLPCPAGSSDCGASALTLVDARDGAFQPLTFAPYRLIHSGDVKIYENLAAQPRAFLVYDWQPAADLTEAVEAMRSSSFDPAISAVVVGDANDLPPVGDVDNLSLPPGSGNGSVEVTRYTPEHIILSVDSDNEALLVLTDAGYPGWVATIDGEPATIRQVNGLFRGLFIPAGGHEIEFHFRPASFRLGAVMSVVGLLLVVALLTIRLIASRRKPEPDVIESGLDIAQGMCILG